MKARITVIVMLCLALCLCHLVAAMKPILDPSPTRLTFKET